PIQAASQDIACSVHVPIERGAARFAFVGAPDGHLLAVPVTSAVLARERRVYRHDSPTSFCRFEGEDVDELPPARVMDAGGCVTARHVLRAKVLVDDVVVLVDDLPRELVVEVAPAVSGALMLATHLSPELLAAPTAALLA